MDQSKTGYLIPELFDGAFGGADDVRHGVGTCEDVLSCSVKTICTRRPAPDPFRSGPVDRKTCPDAVLARAIRFYLMPSLAGAIRSSSSSTESSTASASLPV